MFHSILVSLDGSTLAEQALAPTFSIAAKFAASVLLRRVVVPERTALSQPPLVPSPFMANAEALQRQIVEAQDYLAGLEHARPGVSVHSRVLVGAPPAGIVTTAVDGDIDLIVMSTHGRSGLTRLLYGSVAEAVLRGSPVPVLMIPNRVRSERAADEALGLSPRFAAAPFGSGGG